MCFVRCCWPLAEHDCISQPLPMSDKHLLSFYGQDLFRSEKSDSAAIGPMEWKRIPEYLRYHVLSFLDLFTLCKLFFTAKGTLPRLLVEDFRGHLQLIRPLQPVNPSLSVMDIARALYHSVVVLIRREMQHRLLWSPDLQIQGFCSTLVFFLGRGQQHELGRRASLRLAGLPPDRQPSRVETSEQVLMAQRSSRPAVPEHFLTRLSNGHRRDPDIQQIVRLLRLGTFRYESFYRDSRQNHTAMLHFNIASIAGMMLLTPWQSATSSTAPGHNVELAY